LMIMKDAECVFIFMLNWREFGELTRGRCYKNTMVNYLNNFNPTFSRVKMMQYNYCLFRL